ncbi:ABC transporter ATP-binding protein [Vallitalea pronyensis]|nr:ABC transporter ATP-binding protein [Vallitalea pronyensis]
MVIIKTKNLSKSFANGGIQNHVLRNIDLEIYDKDFTVIMGNSGSGKSTLLYALSGMDRPTFGEIMLNGHAIEKMKEKELAVMRRANVGFVFQQMHLVSNLTLFENVCVSGYLMKNRKPKEVHDQAEELLKRVGVFNEKDRLPSRVSGGQCQRAAIARALINSPKMIFTDEPTGALNSKIGRQVLNVLTELNQEGQNILMVTHDVKAATRATRIIYLHDGQINGEMTLEPYTPEQEKNRERQILAFLEAKGW